MSVEALGISLRQYKNVVSFVRSAVPNKFSHNESNFEGLITFDNIMTTFDDKIHFDGGLYFDA